MSHAPQQQPASFAPFASFSPIGSVAPVAFAAGTVQPASSAPPAGAERAIPELVAQVYEAAPREEQRALLAVLLQPLGLLSLAAIGNGIFAHLRLKGGWPEFRPDLQELARVRTSDMVALVHHVQQVSIESVYALAGLLKTSPVMAGSATAAVLLAVLVRHSRRRLGDGTSAAADPADLVHAAGAGHTGRGWPEAARG